MIAYCLKYREKLCLKILGEYEHLVKDRVYDNFGMTWTQLRKESKDYSIVKVEILEVEE